ncbi:MAG: hypothetical protein RL100_75 [Actinomycetota bacterium]|jgi:hypothetical protein
MPLKIIDPATGEKIGSTRLARQVLTAAIDELDATLVEAVRDQEDWHDNFQAIYRRLTKLEFFEENNLQRIAERGLAELGKHFVNTLGQNVHEQVSNGWVGEQRVSTFVINGSGQAKQLALPSFRNFEAAANSWVSQNLAEPGLITSFKFIDAHRRLAIGDDLLVALGGLAEYAPTRDWLEIGGKVAVVARESRSRWASLIEHARASGGTLLIPVLTEKAAVISDNPTDSALAAAAGLDLQDHATEISSWLALLATTRAERLVLGQYAYAHGADHLKVQAVQDALANKMTQKLSRTRIAFAWLGTPTDSTALPGEVLDDIRNRFRERSAATVLRDRLLRLELTEAEHFTARFGERLALIDTSSRRQGSSYLLAKRSQRWRAYLAQSQGIKVSYAVAPPAKTKSVLDYRVLRAAFRGAPKIGMKPFEVSVARVASAAILLRDLHGPLRKRGSTQLHSESAIHGGIWRLIYRPEQAWKRATVLGWTGLFTRRLRG